MSQSKSFKPTIYSPTDKPVTNVIFRHIKQNPIYTNYVALIEKEVEKTIIIGGSDIGGSDIGISDNEYDDDTDDENIQKDDEDNSSLVESKRDIFYIGSDPIKNFYIGSITSIGLFILYRMLNKR
jgi:hypothetical protein